MSWLKGGGDTLAEYERIKKQQQAQSQSRQYQRFSIQQKDAGQDRDIIILDRDPNAAPRLYEHEFWRDPGYLYVVSPKSMSETLEDPYEKHPVKNGQPSHPYFCKYYSILDLQPWVSKDGSKSGNYTRKLLCVKNNQIPEFYEIERMAMEAFGTLRGLKLRMRRGPDPKSSKIGNFVPLSAMKSMDHVSEDQLVATYGHAAVVNAEGKVLVPANGYLQPFNYEKVFPEPNIAEMCAIFNLPVPGSASGGAAQTSGTPAMGSREDLAALFDEADTGAVATEAVPIIDNEPDEDVDMVDIP